MMTTTKRKQKKFRVHYKNTPQKMAYNAYQQHDVLFLLGPAGTGKTHCAVSFAIEDLINDPEKKKIVLTRPIVESGESLGYLPGDFHEKVNPYMMPFFDIIDGLIDKDTDQRRFVEESLEIVPLAYMRGRTFNNAVCIFDEAQNATYMQLKLFLSRFQEGSKLIITGDPFQSDLSHNGTVDLVNVVRRLENLKGIGIIQFKKDSIIRHPLVGDILESLEE
jgi:phosphate starvation-inducible PhoH-like protein